VDKKRIIGKMEDQGGGGGEAQGVDDPKYQIEHLKVFFCRDHGA
jgi:hypothetical protein